MTVERKLRFKFIWPGVYGSSVNSLICCGCRDFFSRQEFIYLAVVFSPTAITRYG